MSNTQYLYIHLMIECKCYRILYETSPPLVVILQSTAEVNCTEMLTHKHKQTLNPKTPLHKRISFFTVVLNLAGIFFWHDTLQRDQQSMIQNITSLPRLCFNTLAVLLYYRSLIPAQSKQYNIFTKQNSLCYLLN